MKKYPEIYESVLSSDIDPKDNAVIISDLLREICRMVGARYDGGLKEFRTGRNWRVRIENQDDGDDHPYHVLDVGESKNANKKVCLHAGIEGSIAHKEIAWCESDTVWNPNKAGTFGPPVGDIVQLCGTIRVHVAGDFGNYTAQCAAVIVARAYVEALERHLPDRFILVNQKALDLP